MNRENGTKVLVRNARAAWSPGSAPEPPTTFGVDVILVR